MGIIWSASGKMGREREAAGKGGRAVWVLPSLPVIVSQRRVRPTARPRVGVSAGGATEEGGVGLFLPLLSLRSMASSHGFDRRKEDDGMGGGSTVSVCVYLCVCLCVLHPTNDQRLLLNCPLDLYGTYSLFSSHGVTSCSHRPALRRGVRGSTAT